jgi:RNA polymerase sporulation-specific sigma factor
MNLKTVPGAGDPSADEALALAAQQGDKIALNALIARYRDFARKAAARCRGGSLETDDLAQEALLAVLSAAYTYAPDKNAGFRTYAAVCIRNRLRSVLRSEAAGKNLPLNTAVSLDDLEIPDPGDPERRLISEEETAALFRFFDSGLSPLEKQVLLCRIEGLGYAEISRKLRLSEKSIDNALQRVRAKLKKYYNERYQQ